MLEWVRSQGFQTKVVGLILLVIAVIVALGLGFFGPHYYRNFAVKAIVEGGARYALTGKSDDEVRTSMLENLKRQELPMQFSEHDIIIVRHANEVTITLDYEIEVVFPFVDFVAVVPFHNTVVKSAGN